MLNWISTKYKSNMQEKSIKFANKEEASFVNTLRGRVKAYFEENQISRFGNGNMVVKTVFMFALFFIPYLVMITGLVTHPWLIALCWVLMGFGTAGIGLSACPQATSRRMAAARMRRSIFIAVLRDGCLDQAVNHIRQPPSAAVEKRLKRPHVDAHTL